LALFLWRFCAFFNRGVKTHTKQLFGENLCQNKNAKKVEETKLVSCRFSASIFCIAFLAVSLHGGLKNTTKIFSKIKPVYLQYSPLKIGM
jgi:hypothetical protein